MKVTLEIEYTYHGFDTGPVISWLYPVINGKDFDDCLLKGKRYFQTTMRGLGWTKKTDLVEVRRITNGKQAPRYILDSSATLPERNTSAKSTKVRRQQSKGPGSKSRSTRTGKRESKK